MKSVPLLTNDARAQTHRGIFRIKDFVSSLARTDSSEDLSVQPLPVRLWVAYEIGDREERWEVGKFSFLGEAIIAAKAMVDNFLRRYHRPHLRGRQLYDEFLKYGPDLYVEASMEAPVFHGWEYARKRSRIFCGVW